jgi:tetratricopeptide (TPR) repeat protein
MSDSHEWSDKMTIRLKQLCIALVFTILAPFQVAADEVTDVVDDVAAKLVSQLPMDKKIALKSLSPKETGLPEDFLRKLTSDLEAALLTASDFEINLANRATMEDVWQEAVEFNNADFDELFKSANADVMLMISPRAISTGVEIAITAYALTGDNVGKTLASSGSVLLPIDLQANLGVDVNDLNQQMSQVLAEIEKVGQTGGLISNPNTYAEFYHNARILQQRGEVDLAMRNYEQALAEGYLFVDPLLDLLDLANARYGEAGTKKYFEKKIKDNIPRELGELGALILGGDPIELVQPILDKEITFSPLLSTWIQQTYMDWNRFDTLTVGKARTIAAQLISSDYKSGKFQTFYVDKIRGATIGESATRTYDSMMQTEMMVDRTSISRAQVYFRRYADNCASGTPTQTAWFDRFSIQDSVDIEKPVLVCVRKNISDQETTCADLTSNGAYVLPRNPDQFWFTATVHRNYKPESCSSFNFTIGVSCVVSVEYTDINGFNVKTPVLVNHENREEYAPEGISEIVECAGEYYRPRN